MPRAPKLEYPPLILYMIFPAHAWFSTEKINVKLAYTYRGHTKIYFLKWGCRTKKFEKPCFTALFPAWWSWQAVLNYSNISIKLQVDSNILASPEAGQGNCLPYVLAPPSLFYKSGG